MAGDNDDANFFQRDDNFNNHDDFKQFPENRNDAVFDASQYAFFGRDVVEEVELGGLEDDDPPLKTLEDDDFNSHPTILDEDDFVLADGQFDDFDRRPRGLENIVDEPVSENDWRHRTASSTRFDEILQDETDIQGARRWSSDPNFPSSYNPGKLPLHRTSSLSHPHQSQPHYYFPPTELIQTSTPRRPSAPSADQLYHNNHHRDHLNFMYHPDRDISRQLSSSSPSSNFSLSSSVSPPFPHPPPHLPMDLHGFPSAAHRPPSKWLNHSGIRPTSFQSQLPFPNSGPHLHHLRLRPPPPQNTPFGPAGGMNRPPFAPHNPMFLTPENPSDFFSSNNGGNNRHFPRPGPDFYLLRRPQLRSKYMTGDELENILRIQHSATHSDDPYIDDYYNQARLIAKGSNPKHHFCPKTVTEHLPQEPRPSSEPHPFLQVDALGRLPFSSFRRPRPLIELDPPPPPFSGKIELQKLLEEDPILAAKAAIEHCNSIVLDVDDIDRYLCFNPPWDGGMGLGRRRQTLLETLAATLRLVDPLKGRFSPIDDTLFLLVASLPKGRALLSRYLRLVSPGGDLLRLVCMTFFRNLKFFSEIRPSSALTGALSSCVGRMELDPLSACLVAVVCSPDQPPLRPLAGGDGGGDLPGTAAASSLLKSVLERATELLTDPRNGRRGGGDSPNRTLWEASFDQFFTLLTNYCFHTYHRVAGSLFPEEGGGEGSDLLRIEAERAIAGAIPVELLRASLPHTNERQRTLLINFARLSMPAAAVGIDT